MYGPAWLLYGVLAIEGLLLLAAILLVVLAATYLTQFSRFALRSCRRRQSQRG
jgi:hypothetical protein